jgi:hypothetical protein
MWLETEIVIMTFIFGVADRIISGFTVSGIAINRRPQIARGPTSVIKSSHIIFVILFEVLHGHHHLKSFTAGGNCWDSEPSVILYDFSTRTVSGTQIFITSIQMCSKK